MRGHDLISQYRLKTGKAPDAIFIDDFEHAANKWEPNDPRKMPHVVIAGDFIPGLDLRFVFGCIVHGTSRNEARAKALFRRLMMFKPALCAVAVIDRHGWIGVYAKDLGVICE